MSTGLRRSAAFRYLLRLTNDSVRKEMILRTLGDAGFEVFHGKDNVDGVGWRRLSRRGDQGAQFQRLIGTDDNGWAFRDARLADDLQMGAVESFEMNVEAARLARRGVIPD